MISESSIVCALLFFTLALLVPCALHKLFPSLLKHGGAFIFLSMAAVATLRLILLIEIPSSNHLIRSWSLLGGLVRLIRTYPEVVRLIVGLLVAIWAARGIWLVGKDVRELLRARKVAAGYQPENCDRIEEIAEKYSIKYPIVVSQDVGVPYVAGIFRHTIYLPILDLPDKEIGFILRHEAQHIRNHDSTIKCFFRFLRVTMWWNPPARWFWNMLDHLLEMRCDAKLTAHMSDQERAEYAAMLRGLALVLAGRERLSPLVVDELFAVSEAEFMKQRLDIIEKGTGKPPKAASIAVLCVSLVLFFASYLVIFQPASPPPVNSFEEEPEVYYEQNYDDHDDIGDGTFDVFILKGSDGRYQLFVNYVFTKYLSEDEVKSDEYCNYRIFEEGKQK